MADAATPFAERCATEQCRQLLSAPTEPRKPLTPEEKRLRRLAAIDLEAAQAKAAAVDRALRARLAPAYDAKSAAELAEGRQALTEGATKAEARARAARAGELAFAAATADVGALEREQAAYEQRLAQRRLEAARAGGPGPG